MVFLRIMLTFISDKLLKAIRLPLDFDTEILC